MSRLLLQMRKNPSKIKGNMQKTPAMVDSLCITARRDLHN
jgi:hypothetical protein